MVGAAAAAPVITTHRTIAPARTMRPAHGSTPAATLRNIAAHTIGRARLSVSVTFRHTASAHNGIVISHCQRQAFVTFRHTTVWWWGIRGSGQDSTGVPSAQLIAGISAAYGTGVLCDSARLSQEQAYYQRSLCYR